MNDPRLNYANEYPVEILPPDISGYKKTNTGVDYILTLDSGFAGPHVLVTAVVHGNEPCGAIAIDWYFKNNSLQITGKIQQVKIFLACLLISIFGVLGTGVIFVSALMFSHG